MKWILSRSLNSIVDNDSLRLIASIVEGENLSIELLIKKLTQSIDVLDSDSALTNAIDEANMASIPNPILSN